MKKQLLLSFFILILSHQIAYGQSDTIPTAQGQLIITPIQHGSLLLEYKGKTIYVDPYGGEEHYKGVKARTCS